MAKNNKNHALKAILLTFGLLSFLISHNSLAQTKCKEPEQHHKTYAPITYQTTDYTCGPASALSLLKSWKQANKTEIELVKVFNTNTKVGTLPKDFIAGFKKLNIKAEYFEKIDFKKLKKLYESKKSLIPLVDSEGDHWVLVTDFSDDKITVMDPWPDDDKCGYQSYTQKEFEKIWHAKIGNQAVLAVTKPN